MRCDKCTIDAEQVVYCDCFAVLCRECFGGHVCGRESLARFTRQPEPKIQLEDVAIAAFNLRDYQQAAIDFVIEALR